MSDLVEEYRKEQRKRDRSSLIITTIVIVGIVAVFALSVKNDKDRQKALNTYGGAVGVENQTDHRVTLRLFLHDSPDEPVLSHTIEPRGYWVIRDSMSKREVSDFPPINWLDSALFIFDDTLYLWQAEKGIPWYVAKSKHYIQEGTCWRYMSLTVRRASRNRSALYRPLRVYYLTDEDYKTALEH